MRILDEKRYVKGSVWRKYARIALALVILWTVLSSIVGIYATTDKNEVENDKLFATSSVKIGNIYNALPTDKKKSAKTGNERPLSDEKEDQGDKAPEEYGDFIESLPESVVQKLPDGAFSDDTADLSEAARSMSGVGYLLDILFEAFGASVESLLPTLALLMGIIIISAVCRAVASSLGGGLARTVDFAANLCSYCAIAAVAVGSLEGLKSYFDSLFSSVASFVPLLGVLYASGGNLNGAASGTLTLSATLAVCQFFFSKTVIPVFCVSVSLALLNAFDGVGGLAGRSISASIKKWYATALSLIMTVLTASLAAQGILAAKADGAAMRGAKFAASSFIPISGGAVSSTLGTLAASVELIRGSVGIIGIVIILLLLIPVIVELAVMRGILALASFLAGMLGCGSEKNLIDELGSLYGYLEGIAAISSVVFLVAFAIFAASGAAVA